MIKIKCYGPHSIEIVKVIFTFTLIRNYFFRFNMDLSGALKKKTGYMFMFKNFSYTRSFLPLQFWNSSLKLDFNDKEIELQVSLSE